MPKTFQDQNRQLAVEELEKALAPTRGRRAERTQNPVLPPSRVMAALVAGMDRVGKQSANLKEFQVRLVKSLQSRNTVCALELEKSSPGNTIVGILVFNPCVEC